MNKFLTLALLLFSLLTSAQDIAGDWNGEVEISSGKLGIAFHLTKAERGFTATIDIPKQGLNGYKIEAVTFKDSTLTLNMTSLKIDYSGHLNKLNEFIGNLSQGGKAQPLNLRKGRILINRPQEPKPPFSYYIEEVSFQSLADKTTLNGTLTLPKKEGKFPVVIIISGSGPQDRDGSMFGHKLYWVIADQLTKNGIGVLRFDDRGTGESDGNAEETNISVNSADVKGALAYLKTRKDINTAKIGLMGHSIGGIIAPKIASESKDINFIVLMAAPGVDGGELMLSQKAASERLLGLNEMQIQQGRSLFAGMYDIIVNSTSDKEGLKVEIADYFKKKVGTAIPETQLNAIIDQVTSEEILSLIKSRPSDYLSEVTCPVLALNGSKDFQVPATDNLAAIKKAVESNGNPKVKIVALENLNHLFQECKTGAMREYSDIEQTISPIALKTITDWIKEQTK